MWYEDIKIKKGDTISQLSVDYGYAGKDWEKVWNDPQNAKVVKQRGTPELIQPNDVFCFPIPWKTVKRDIKAEADGASIVIQRDGLKGVRLSWTQTVFQSNQPVPDTKAFCVDGCPADDDLPFYWTDAEILANPVLKQTFSDRSRRPTPTAAMGTTTWRAIVSIAVVTEKRVTIFDSWVWGWDMTPKNKVSTVGPRQATKKEVEGHLNLLRNGVGTVPKKTFTQLGWTFRAAP